MSKLKTEKYYDEVWKNADFPLKDYYVHQRIARGDMPGSHSNASSAKSQGEQKGAKQSSRKR